MKFKFFNKLPKIHPDFKHLKNVKPPINDDGVRLFVQRAKNKNLWTRYLKTPALIGGTGVVLSAIFIDSYIKNHTGCFLETNDKICKVRELSCCNTGPSEYAETCPESILQRLRINKNACSDFDLNDECCKDCDCDHHPCEPNEKLSCRKASVPEAVTYFFNSIPSGIGQQIQNILTSPLILKIFLAVFLFVVCGIIFYKFI